MVSLKYSVVNSSVFHNSLEVTAKLKQSFFYETPTKNSRGKLSVQFCMKILFSVQAQKRARGNENTQEATSAATFMWEDINDEEYESRESRKRQKHQKN